MSSPSLPAPSIYDWLTSLAIQHPELTNCIITALLWSLGDVLAQLFERQRHQSKSHLPLSQSPVNVSTAYGPMKWSFNTARTLRIASYAGLIFAPITKAWFEVLESTFPGEGLAVAAQRMLLDQACYSSCVIISLFVWVGMLESKFNIDYTVNKIRQNYWSAITTNWMVWPFLQLIIQGAIPLQYRMVVGALLNVPWTMYLAWRANKSETPTTVRQHQTLGQKIWNTC